MGFLTVRALIPGLYVVPAILLGACIGEEEPTLASTSATGSTSGSTSDSDALTSSTDMTTTTSGTETSTTATTAGTTSTTSVAVCGDGVVEEGEVCDDGILDNSYGGCSPGCKQLGPHCGDGYLDPEHEVCDDEFNNGGYDSCSPDCKGFGPYCGDGILEPGYELCDDGNTDNNDDCSYCGQDVCKLVKATPSVANVHFVLDKSESMALDLWDADDDPKTPAVTRWSSLHGVVTNVLTDHQDELNLGVTLFPSTAAVSDYNEMACVVSPTPEVECASHNKDAILAAIPTAGSTNLHGVTPSSAGVYTALMHLKGLDPASPRAIVFVTDGAANCPGSWMPGDPYEDLLEVYDDALHMIVADAWSSDQIPTYVVGIDISTSNTGMVIDGTPDDVVPYDQLADLATKGGKPQLGVDKFYDATNQAELQAALDQIAEDARSCFLSIEPPALPFDLTLRLDKVIPKVKDCNTEDGWVYSDDTYSRIQLCGSACEQVLTSGTVDVEYHCQT